MQSSTDEKQYHHSTSTLGRASADPYYGVHGETLLDLAQGITFMNARRCALFRAAVMSSTLYMVLIRAAIIINTALITISYFEVLLDSIQVIR